LLPIGKVLKSNGTKGEVLIGFRDIDLEDISTKEPVYITFDGLPVPFFILSMTPKGSDRALVQLSDVDNLRDAEELVGRIVEADYFEEEEDGEDIAALVGWTVEGLGEITGWLDIPGNPCLEVATPKGGSVLLPFHEDLVRKLDERKRLISMDIPEGLV